MFSKNKEPDPLEAALTKALVALDTKAIGTAEYEKILDEVVKLKEMQDQPDRVSMETWALIGANLLGILIVIRHEHVNVISSHAMGMVRKLR